MTSPPEVTSGHEQLVFDGFDCDFSEKIYHQPNRELLTRCNKVILDQCGIKVEDFEARKANAGFIGSMQVGLHNRLFRFTDPSDVVIEDFYIALCMQIPDNTEVVYG